MVHLQVNQYNKVKDLNDEYDATLAETVHSSRKNGENYGYINFETATRGEIEAFRQGWVDRMINDKNFVQKDPNQTTNQNENDTNMPNAFSNQGGQSQSKQRTHLPPGVKPGTFAHNQSDYIDYSNNMAAFADKLLIALLSGFGIGAITTAVYIFINLSKVTVSLK